MYRYFLLLFEMVYYKFVGDKIKLGILKFFILFSVNCVEILYKLELVEINII